MVVTPRANATRIERVDGGALRVRVSAPPVDGAANAALVRYLAEVLGVPKSSVDVVAGASGRRKRIRVAGMTPDQVIERLERVVSVTPSGG